jgi:hypothetical protein
MGICTSVATATTAGPASCPQNSFFSAVSQTIADADNSLVGSGTARQIQLALKVIF